jgi:predicted phage terminase large subunit-like protein
MSQTLALDRHDPDVLASSIFDRVADSLSRPNMPLNEYLKAAWPLIEPSRPLVMSWHIELVLEHLAAVDLGQITRLLINVPPRSLKSNTVSLAWPTWSWTQRAWRKWIFASYSASLSTMHSIARRRVLESDWFLQNWGDSCKLESDQNQKAEYQNTQRGVMIATSVGGSITGKGGDVLVIDDLINPVEAESKTQREAAIAYYKQTLLTRLDDKKTGAIVIIEQRTHNMDLSGTVIREGGFVHVKVPAEAPVRSVVKFPLSGREILREEGSVICEEREDKATLAAQRAAMGTRAYAAQYQQEPIASDSGHFHIGWWKYHKLIPIHDIVWQWSWDTAMEEGEENDYSVGILFGHGAYGTFIERVVRQRLQYPELKRVMVAEWQARPGHVLLIEDKVSGKSLAQDLIRNTNLPVLPVKPAGDKVFRASLCSPYVESGRVSLKEDEPWIADFLEETSMFPQFAHDDQVDAFSQGMNHFYLGAPKPIASMGGGGVAPFTPKPDWL